MRGRNSGKFTYQRSVESTEEMKQSALKGINNGSNMIFKEGDIDEILARYGVKDEDTPAGSSKDLNESEAVEYNEQTSAAGQVKVADNSDQKNSNVEVNKIKKEAVVVKKEKTFNKNLGSEIRKVRPFVEEPQGHYQPHPMDHSFRNFIAEPVSVDLRGFASSSSHAPMIDNMAGRWNNEMPVSNNFGNSYFSAPGGDRAAETCPNQWPYLRSNQNPIYPYQAPFQGDFNRPWQNSFLPVAGDPYYTTGWQRPAAYPTTWEVSEPPVPAGFQPQAGFIDPTPSINTGFSNSYENSQYDQANVRQPRPDPWDLQKPIGFSRSKEPFKNIMVSELGPSRNPGLVDWAPSTPCLPMTDRLPDNPSFVGTEDYKLFPEGENPFFNFKPKEEDKEEPVKNDTIFGEISSTGEVIYKCQMCDSIVDTNVNGLLDRRYCSDCVYFNHDWWNEHR